MIIKQERGWAGHFILSHRCLFRRNTLITDGNVYVVVSTIGNVYDGKEVKEVGVDRYYETMAFYSDDNDHRYHDADVGRQIDFNSKWCINNKDADDVANDMHDDVVKEIEGLIENNLL